MLWDRFVRAGGQTCHGRVLAVEHLATGIRAKLMAELIRGAVFVDATGHQSRFIRRQAGDVTGYQLAYGILADVEGEPASSDRMTLMDYRGETPRDDIPNPSFLYAFQRESGLWFMEETVLVGPNATSFGTLKSRLENRLERQGVKVRRVLEQEHCLIPMNPPLPRVRQRSLGFGGAASMVHPASGYMVAHSASLAPKVAESLLVGLGSYKGEPREAVREAWNVIWPRTARQSHALYRLGSTILSEFDAPTIRAFFQAFFEQPGDRWRGYLSRTLGVSGVMASMWGTFGELRPGVRKAMFAALARNPMESWQSIRGGLVE